jgi:dolichol-phosphate mannosyltransferase
LPDDRRIRVLIPTYQERDNVEPLVRKVFAIAPQVEVMVIDDSSPDGTAGVVRALQSEFPNLRLHLRPRKEGLAKAYLDAFVRALADPWVEAVVTMDADFSHDPGYLPEMIEKGQTHDVVIGSRYTSGGGVEGWEFWRRLLSAWANFYCRTITGMPVRDCTAGFMLARTAILRKLPQSAFSASGYAFLMELKYALWLAGGSFAEVPIVFRNRRSGESKLSGHIISEGVWAPWRLRFRKRPHGRPQDPGPPGHHLGTPC